MTPDVNVLLAAARSDHPNHAVARDWLDGAIAATSGGTPLTLMPMVVTSVLRLLTSPRVFREPSSTTDAVGFVDALLDAGGARVASLGPEWPRLRTLCLDRSLGANAVPDAWLAAAVLQLGEHLVTFDRDFKALLRRSQLTLLAPLASD